MFQSFLIRFKAAFQKPNQYSHWILRDTNQSFDMVNVRLYSVDSRSFSSRTKARPCALMNCSNKEMCSDVTPALLLYHLMTSLPCLGIQFIRNHIEGTMSQVTLRFLVWWQIGRNEVFGQQQRDQLFVSFKIKRIAIDIKECHKVQSRRTLKSSPFKGLNANFK